MKVLTLVLATLASLVAFSSSAFASKTIYIDNDDGGIVDEFKARAEKWGREHRKVVIRGECASSCVIYTQPKYGIDICAMPTAKLLIHHPYIVSDTKHWTINYSDAARQDAEKLWNEAFFNDFPTKARWWLRFHRVPDVYQGYRASDLLDPGSARDLFVKNCVS